MANCNGVFLANGDAVFLPESKNVIEGSFKSSIRNPRLFDFFNKDPNKMMQHFTEE